MDLDQRVAALELQVAAILAALDGLDTSDRKAGRDLAGVIRWASGERDQASQRRADIGRQIWVALGSIVAAIVAGLVMAKLK